MLNISNTLLMSRATVIVYAWGIISLNPLASVLLMLCSAVQCIALILGVAF